MNCGVLKMYKLSRHAREERLDRMVYLMTEVGVGEEIITVQFEGTRQRLFDTGLVLVLAPEDDLVITGYLTSIDKLTAMWVQAYGTNRIPHAIYTKIVRSVMKHELAVNTINAMYHK